MRPYQLFNTFFLIVLLLTTCDQNSEYDIRLEREMGRDLRVDSLFLGYHFGMTAQEFFDHSWQLNKQQIITGQKNITYKIEGLQSPASMEFYPEFKDDKIYKIPVEVYYDGWSPWNTHLFADSLLAELTDLYEQKYNTEFFKHTFPGEEHETIVDIQGNRQITMYVYDDRSVHVEFLDLTSNKRTSE